MTEEVLRRGAKVDRYEIRELIGHGGMSEVYRAWDAVLERDVAVKVLRLRDDAMLKRFEREAEAIGKIDCENVVQIHDFRLHGDHPYIVMEFLRGMSLQERLSKSGAMSSEEAVSVTLGVCRGVAACHRLGIIHRDLKPANVFLAETAHYGTVVKILDFGVAKPRRYAVDLTEPGQIAGTPAYVAPEILKGLAADELSDQYGIGLLLYVALTGEPPFRKKERADLAAAILGSDFVPLKRVRPDVPDELVAVLMKALSAERAARFASVMALGRALMPFAPDDEREISRVFFDEESRANRRSQMTTVVQKVLPEPAVSSNAPKETRAVIPRLPPATIVDSSMVRTGRDQTWMRVDRVIETGNSKPAGARSAPKATVRLLLGTAAVLAVVWVAMFLRSPRAAEIRIEPPVEAREGIQRTAGLAD